ncbi:MAG: multicopper oxidase domain-containing protein [Acidimicrobiia bacterium]|nr:multicopper oxidase domain-containing protein [Acidimicrobiia bacterium]
MASSENEQAAAESRALTRRGFLRGVGLGGLAGAAGMGGSRALGRLGDEAYPGGIGSSEVHADPTDLYGGIVDVPSWAGSSSLDAVTFPSPESASEYEFDVTEQRLEVGAGAFVDAWVYGGSVPGPLIRAREGDRVRIRLRNLTPHPHSLHLHGRHAPAMDGWEPIPPGGEFVYEIEAAPAGVHPYHCHTAPLAEHIRRGLYGMMIVDPREGRPAATEVALLISGFTIGDRPNAVVAWNGVAGYYDRYPIKVATGEPIRLYLVNMVEGEPLASFHLHSQTFGVIPSGMGDRPIWYGDVIPMTQGERAILEFVLPEEGRYMFHPHQHHLAMRGAMGWFAAV